MIPSLMLIFEGIHIRPFQCYVQNMKWNNWQGGWSADVSDKAATI
jgi:hypothetical protein